MPGGLDALPQVVDDNGAVHGVPDGEGHIDDDGQGHHSQPDPLAVEMAAQPDHGAFGILGHLVLDAGKFLLGAHASCTSFVWDS